MIALSFLGVGPYNETRYLYDGKQIQTRHFVHALSEFIKPDKLYAIMTHKAKATNYEEIKKLCDCEPIDIPDGKSEDEFWIIFDKITSVVKVGDEVVFDITHGFRSQPFIVIVLLLYLKATKNIKINNILYGAYEARNENNVSPVFELKSFIELVEWANAAREFAENGNMKYFKTLLSNIHKSSHLGKLDNPSKQLLGTGKDLEILTDAFDTIRLNEVFDTTVSFSNRLNDLLNDLENHPRSKPFKTVLEQIVNKLLPISAADKSVFSMKGMEAQKAILNWYVDTGKFQKAVTLSREYIISKYLVEILKTENTFLLNKGTRENAKNMLGEMLQYTKSGIDIKGRKGEYAKLWNTITRVRNDINHAGMNQNPTNSKDIIKSSHTILKIINENF